MKITEEWLKRQGWEVSRYYTEFRVEIFHYATKMFGKDKAILTDAHELKIFRDYEEPCDVYADVLIDNVDSVEKLMKALTLCGVGNFEEYDWLYETWLDKACRWLVEHSYNSETSDSVTLTSVFSDGPLTKAFRKSMEAVIKESLSPAYDAEYLQSKIDAHTKYIQEHGITSEQQLAELDEMRGRKSENPTSPWRKASDELPKDGEHILFATSLVECGTPYYETVYYPEPGITDRIDYWMPIPDLPKEN